MMTAEDVSLLACPSARCRGTLEFIGDCVAGRLRAGRLHCARCGHGWPVRGGIPYLVNESTLRLSDRLGRLGYELYAPFYDKAVEYLLPVLQLEAVSRENYARQLRLEKLRPNKQGPVRILEVGIGGGGNLPLLQRHLAPHLNVQVWGVDLSRGMLEQCAQRVQAAHRRLNVRLLVADAHALPFPNASFDRVFHVGAIASYGDPALGLAEMARVARPGTPIAVVDEQLDPNRFHFPHQYAMFWLARLSGAETAAPVKHLPRHARNVQVEQVSRFYYCLTFRMPAGKSARTRQAKGTVRR